MNQSTNTTNFDGKQLANEIWTLHGAARPANADKTSAAPDNQTNPAEQSEMNNIPDLATEISSRLE